MTKLGIMDVPSYEATYREYVNEFADELFLEERMSSVLAAHEATIGDVAKTENPRFAEGVEAHRTHVSDRLQAVSEFSSQ